MENILEIKNLSMEFKKTGNIFKAVDGVDFELRKGEVLGIIGESGSGKSTIAKLITGLLKATEGQVFYRGQDLLKLKGGERKVLNQHIQMVFQNAVGSFNPRMKIGKSIEEIIQLLGECSKDCLNKKVEDLLVDVGLKGEYADKYPHEISGGECQRAAIARAMAVNPQILICDEATSALDVSAQARIVDLLVHLKEEHGLSMLFITHDLPLVSSLTDRLIIMSKGKIVESGNTKEIIENPKSEYTKKLLEAVL